ncbi:coenzyme F420-0:L-glutamate ligase [Auraticoccus monumenti]|uniref:Coenzyme F420-0:L-glutamate ligase / coenzyme F420-1:gamma-L-glutamate ligase n=1 Tax=Auraticoccus monumenti TaxID=675864 RepID=A0A1G6Z0P9_9ACTN|nr:coenzyme F420-0:L-glutamate ligase [Auraticoccus monumenti]SDD96324.1 coenzyme F420-0:L-glutamate ligase / coenzyme F420-1:gamma-L-glutamate ligase [Auraticoccus monumenti]
MSHRLLVFAPAGVGEVSPGDDLAGMLLTACTEDPDGPLRDGDVLVVTSKVVSKAEGRSRDGDDREAAISDETLRTVARRGPTRIVQNAQGLVQAAAGVDASNVVPGTVLLLPADPDASAARLREELQQRTGLRLGVVVSDTSGRAWRHGQTDLAVGAAGVRPSLGYAGELDSFGRELAVTQMAVADELAAAGDLVKAKLAGRPVAVVRGLAELVVDDAEGARSLSRTGPDDMFARGSRESVLHAVLTSLGRAGEYEGLVGLDGPDLEQAVLAGVPAPAADALRGVLRAVAPTATQ